MPDIKYAIKHKMSTPPVQVILSTQGEYSKAFLGVATEDKAAGKLVLETIAKHLHRHQLSAEAAPLREGNIPSFDTAGVTATAQGMEIKNPREFCNEVVTNKVNEAVKDAQTELHEANFRTYLNKQAHARAANRSFTPPTPGR